MIASDGAKEFHDICQTEKLKYKTVCLVCFHLCKMHKIKPLIPVYMGISQETETGLVAGTCLSAAKLCTLTHLFQLQNTKKLYETKDNCGAQVSSGPKR